jgi:hypothetical protein
MKHGDDLYDRKDRGVDNVDVAAATEMGILITPRLGPTPDRCRACPALILSWQKVS